MQETKSCEQCIVSSPPHENRDWTQKTDICWVVHSPVRKTSNDGTLQELFALSFVMWTSSRRWEGYRFSKPCSCGEGTARLYPTRNVRQGAPAVNGLHR